MIRMRLIALLVVSTSLLAAGSVSGGLQLDDETAPPVSMRPAGQPAEVDDGPLFQSPIVSRDTPGHAIDIQLDVTGAKQLVLIVDDADDGFMADWANWIEPRLIDARGEVTQLADMEWARASAGWGQVRLNANANGGALRVNGEEVEGIGTHANSVIVYELPANHDFVEFIARAGLDDGGTTQGGGATVRFQVITDEEWAGTAHEGRDPQNAVRQLDVAEHLDVTLFASEPMITSPTQIDIDHRGRVWLADVQNYRGHQGTRPEGDRILIVEDTTGDGVADKVTTFYQGNDIDSLLGITVLGNKVIVSCSPDVFILHDDDGDDIADRKEVLFTNTGIPQHDHSAHRFTFGPDGKLYWNFGDTGGQVHDAEGNIVVDLAGNEVRNNGQPYRKGMAFRCNLDGSEFEVLGHNFRNPYELTVDSFGTVWQSDNDDDGNRGSRVNFVMEFGNYGYTDERTGAGWNTDRINRHPNTSLAHWHHGDPGVVPNVLDTGAGSPSGITFYEGELLGPAFRNQMIHAEPGKNIVRAYPMTRQGAGYEGSITPLLYGARDKWFRPVAVRAAPDGSLFVADWYDPGVGGHAKGDQARGRVFRIAPPEHPYTVPDFDFTTAAGAAEALKSTTQAVRYLAWTALHEMGNDAIPALRQMYESDNPRYRARALWLLSKLEGSGTKVIDEALGDADADIRITALRAARQLDVPILPYVSRAVEDPSPAVRREALIALRHHEGDEAADLWAQLAMQHTHGDSFYLEALGIGADRQWNRFFDAWLAKVGDDWNSAAGREIVWRSRAPRALPLLGKMIADPATSPDVLPRYFRALDFHEPEARRPILVSLLTVTGDRADAITSLALRQIGSVDLEANPTVKQGVERAMEQADASAALRIIQQFNLRDHADRLVEILVGHPQQQMGVQSARLLLDWDQRTLIEQRLSDDEVAAPILQTLGMTGELKALAMLEDLAKDADGDRATRAAAIEALGRTRQGEQHLLEMVKANAVAAELEFSAANVLHASGDERIREEAGKRLTLPSTAEAEPLPPIAELVSRSGNAERGKVVYMRTCIACHQVNGAGIAFGPDLSGIGTKLAKETMYHAILDPSANISFDYRGVLINLRDGNQLMGYLTSETDDALTVVQMGGIATEVQKANVVERTTLDQSLMPTNLQSQMTAQELVDLVEYLTTLTE